MLPLSSVHDWRIRTRRVSRQLLALLVVGVLAVVLIANYCRSVGSSIIVNSPWSALLSADNPDLTEQFPEYYRSPWLRTRQQPMDTYHFRLGLSKYEHHVIVNWTFTAPGYYKVSEHPENEKPPEVSIIVTAHNQQETIKETIETIFALSMTKFEFVLVLDDCTDRTAVEALRIIEDHQENLRTNARDFQSAVPGLQMSRFVLVSTRTRLHENRANNLGIRLASAPYLLLLEENTVPQEMGWDKALLQPFVDFPGDNLLAVSGRCAADLTVRPVLQFRDEHVLGVDRPAGMCSNLASGDTPAAEITAPDRRVFSVRAVATRGPLILDAAKVRRLRYVFDEAYPTSTIWDVPELCIRGALAERYRCGHYPVASRMFVARSSEEAESSAIENVNAYRRLVIRYEDYLTDGAGQTGVDRLVNFPKDFRGNRTIVSAVSRNHFLSLIQLFKRITMHEPNTPVVIYDMGLTENLRRNITSWPNVQLRTFNFSNYPDYFRLVGDTRGEYAWKPIMVLDVLRDFGGLVLWLDSGNLIRRPLDRTWNDLAAAGVYSSRTDGVIKKWTHEGTLAYLKVPVEHLDVGNCNGAIVGINRNHARAIAKVALPWSTCALERACIAPPGSSRANHRQDQAALTILMRTNAFSCEWKNGIWSGSQGLDPEGKMDITVQNDEYYPIEWRTFIPEDDEGPKRLEP